MHLADLGFAWSETVPQLISLDPKDGKSVEAINLSTRGHAGEPPQGKQGSWDWNILSFVSMRVDYTESEDGKLEETQPVLLPTRWLPALVGKCTWRVNWAGLQFKRLLKTHQY